VDRLILDRVTGIGGLFAETAGPRGRNPIHLWEPTPEELTDAGAR
jgi:hypothetical protein